MIVTLENLPRKKQHFVVFEGVNGSGKSSLISRLSVSLASENRQVIATREPGGTKLGDTLREILQEFKSGKLSPISELLLFAADRAQHVEEVLKPAISNRSLVLCDRYYYSTLAFQGYGRGLDISLINSVCSTAIQGLTPDLVILLDLDPKTGLSRTKGRGIEDTFEAESIAFHTRVRNGFLEVAKSASEPFLIVDANKSADEVYDYVRKAII